MNTNKALELGFLDEIMYTRNENKQTESVMFSRMAITNKFLDKLKIKLTIRLRLCR